MPLRFGDFVFDGEARELTRQGRRVELSPKAFELLATLLDRRPRALARAELSDLLWPHTAVGYTSLAGIVSELRRALGDDTAEPRFLRTVRSYGYAFCGEARQEPPVRARAVAAFPCALLWAGREIGLAEGENLIGRSEDCAIRIDSAKVSRHHARIVVQGGSATLEDLRSKNGTLLWGRRIEGGAQLAEGDQIAIGAALLVFRAGHGQGSTATG